MQNSQQTDVIRAANSLELLNILRAQQPISRSGIRDFTTLSAASITNITTALLEAGVIRVAEADEPSKAQIGRPRALLALNPDVGLLASVFIAFPGIGVEVVDYAGSVVGEASSAADVTSLNAAQLTDQVAALVEEALDHQPAALWKTILTTQGVTTADNRALLWSPTLFDDALGFVGLLAERLNTEVEVHNDTKMQVFGLHDAKRDAGQSQGVVLLSYGVGLGLYLNGDLFRSATSSASEMGHMPYITGGAKCRCGKLGCVEAYASDYAILRAARGLPEGELIADDLTEDDVEQILNRAKTTDGPERRALEQAAKALGFALASVFSLFDVFPVLFAGKAARFLDYMEPQLRLTLRENFRARTRTNFEFDVVLDDRQLTLDGARKKLLSLADQELSRQRPNPTPFPAPL